MPIINPFESEIAIKHSNAYILRNGQLVAENNNQIADTYTKEIHDRVTSLFVGDFPCLGAKQCMHNNLYKFGFYDKMINNDCTRGLCYDFFGFVKGLKDINKYKKNEMGYKVFIATFKKYDFDSEAEYHVAFWQQLQMIYDLDKIYHVWDPNYDADVNSKNFAYSFSEMAFFVIGFSPFGKRNSRKCFLPVMVFNPHFQINKLRERGVFNKMKTIVRKRIERYDGCPNYSLADFGEYSEAEQYSGYADDAKKINFITK